MSSFDIPKAGVRKEGGAEDPEVAKGMQELGKKLDETEKLSSAIDKLQGEEDAGHRGMSFKDGQSFPISHGTGNMMYIGLLKNAGIAIGNFLERKFGRK
ncbi:MAG: hypothetical protein HGA33_03850 [Candidatus Moranbacteria bacterium]|nr:hypothetical protein [Candidatus Moranbacteria bacterium]